MEVLILMPFVEGSCTLRNLKDAQSGGGESQHATCSEGDRRVIIYIESNILVLKLYLATMSVVIDSTKECGAGKCAL